MILEEPGVFHFQGGLLGDSACRSADMERPHGELSAGLADGLSGDDADGFAPLHRTAGGEVSPVAADADSAPCFASQHGADFHPLNAGRLDRVGKILIDLLVDVHDKFIFIILDLLERDAAHDAIAQRLNHLAALDDGSDVDAIDRSAINL